MTEFTGERVIPGQVNDDLWAEHLARYVFARSFAGTHSLDIGSGAGYGVAELSKSGGTVVGVDVASDALSHARAHYPFENARFLQASATALPFHAESFDLITAFEVIEHLTDWPYLLREARRVLRKTGVFLVSTPNRSYYTESRAEHGPNPFHVHEFEFDEFRAAITEIFPHVIVLTQNWTGAIVFTGATESTDVRKENSPSDPNDAHFFLAICSAQPLTSISDFVYIPRSSNLLREREHHIHLLEAELAQSKRWLAETTAERDAIIELHRQQKDQLEESNRWAQKAGADWKAAMDRVAQLQDEYLALQTKAAARLDILEAENRKHADWATDLDQRLAAKSTELAETVRLLDAAEKTVIERTEWAQRLSTHVAEVEALLEMIRQSRWVKLGRSVGLGPDVSPKVD